jgi:predicted metalloprotease
VITHEIGHHVQNLLGILPKVQQMQRGLDQAEANQLQVEVAYFLVLPPNSRRLLFVDL